MASDGAASSELLFLFESHGVDKDICNKIIDAGMTTVATFGAMVESSAELRASLKTDFELTGATLIEKGQDCEAGGRVGTGQEQVGEESGVGWRQ